MLRVFRFMLMPVMIILCVQTGHAEGEFDYRRSDSQVLPGPWCLCGQVCSLTKENGMTRDDVRRLRQMVRSCPPVHDELIYQSFGTCDCSAFAQSPGSQTPQYPGP
ncbi:hypothetical protein [Falsiphaeobacter marinintestinus]|uniref:hypothetical protein n=1 Tax=Falsiphaeobacter marinintestinus TaxID=1492905 RepID=UPI0011B550A3|nr:hypothetical protein [Phaeobacter marinintestinus]